MSLLVGWGNIAFGLVFIIAHELSPRHRPCRFGKYGVLVHAGQIVLGAMALVLR